MSDLLPPGNMPAPNADADDVSAFPDFFASDMWPSLWPRVIHRYATEALRDADLAGLGSADIAFAWVDALTCMTYWSSPAAAWRPVEDTNKIQPGTLLTGTRDATKPIKTINIRQNGTTDTAGLVSLALVNTAIMSVTVTAEYIAGGEQHAWVIHPGYTNATIVTLALFSLTTGIALTSSAYTLNARIEYQS